jgi:predicted nucleic acid-binding protein
MKVISDSSPLITFHLIDKIDILEKIVEEIVIPEAVYNEITVISKKGSKIFQKWAIDKVIKINDISFIKILEMHLGKGEAQVIALANEIEFDLLLIDDLKARKIAQQLDHRCIGSLGILLNAKKQGTIPNIKSIVDLMLEQDIYIDNNLYDHILKLANE